MSSWCSSKKKPNQISRWVKSAILFRIASTSIHGFFYCSWHHITFTRIWYIRLHTTKAPCFLSFLLITIEGTYAVARSVPDSSRPAPRKKVANEVWRSMHGEWAPPKDTAELYGTTKEALQYWRQQKRERGQPYGWPTWKASGMDKHFSHEEHWQGRPRWWVQRERHGLTWTQYREKFCSGGFAGRQAKSGEAVTSGDEDEDNEEELRVAARYVVPGFASMGPEEANDATRAMKRKHGRGGLEKEMVR
ncbi:unnamed protein product, partial [Amoebophrya sp. A25]|eukprot:GSA25T00010801001.1